MKKYIYGIVVVAIIIAAAVFLMKPSQKADRPAFTTLAITFRLPEGYEFTEGAPFKLTWRGENPGGILSIPFPDKNFNPLISPYKFRFAPVPGFVAVVLNARLYYCHKASRMCFQDDFQTRVPLTPQNGSSLSWLWEITPKKA